VYYDDYIEVSNYALSSKGTSMHYNLIQIQSNIPEAVDAIEVGLSQNLLKCDPLNIWVSDIDFCQHLVEKKITFDKLGNFVRTHCTHIFNLQRNVSILQMFRQENTIRFSFMTYAFSPSRMLTTLRDNTHFAFEAITLETDDCRQIVYATRHNSHTSSRRFNVTNKWKDGKTDAYHPHPSIPSDPRLWFPDGISLPIYHGEKLLHRWFRSKSCTLITSDPAEELISAINYLKYAEEIREKEIAYHTGIDLNTITEVLSTKALTSPTQRERATI
jgi:hypothetical protein